MKQRIIFFLKYYFFWIAIFVFLKILFIIYHLDKFQTSKISDYFGIILNGLKLDVSLASYFMLFIALTFILLSGFKNSLERHIIYVFTIIIFALVSLLHITDLELYNYWRFRLDEEFLSYLSSPKEMLANLSWYHYPLVLGIIAILYFLFIKIIYTKVLKLRFDVIDNFSWKNSLVFLIIAPALLIPIRGGLGTAPINIGSAYFHKEEMVNHAAINPVWSLIYSYTEKDKLSYSVDFLDNENEEKLLNNLFTNTENELESVLNSTNPNVILILLESFSSNLLTQIVNGDSVTPQLNSLIKEGLYFSNFYASGGNSKSGLGAVISGYPSLPKTCILHYEKKSQSLPGISKDLKEIGYNSKFLYGGDIDFAHFKSFLLNNKFDTIISHVNFPKSDYMSKWGVPDHIVFERLLKECNQSTQPFFNTFFTLSSHEPYIVPMETVIKGNGKAEKFMNSVYYTDKALGNFIEEAKKQNWWDNTLVILVADHGSRVEDLPQYDSKRYHIPMLWIGGALKDKGKTITKYGSQVDLSVTLLNQMGVKHEEYKFSKDLLDPNSGSFANYGNRNDMGFISDSMYMVFDLTHNQFIVTEGNNQEYGKNILKAHTQWLLRDFSER